MSAIPQTILELTDKTYSELVYSQTQEVTGVFINQIRRLLNKCDITVTNFSEVFDLDLEQAIQEFQKRMGLSQTGVLDDTTWQSMLWYANKYSDEVVDDTEESEEYYDNISNSPHFNSFFHEDNLKTYRRNHQDIKIVLGNNTVVKTIKDVIMRSVSVEVDTSGNPIYEVYEFIAKDVIESDEITDTNKYQQEEKTKTREEKYIFPWFT